MWFIPDADLLAMLSPDRDVLTLHRFDLEQRLAGQDDYLVVDEPPMVVSQLGGTYEYAVSAKTKQGGITYALTSGPPGLEVDGAGVVTWNVPDDWSELLHDVTVTLTNDNGLEIPHSWTIQVPELLPPPTE